MTIWHFVKLTWFQTKFIIFFLCCGEWSFCPPKGRSLRAQRHVKPMNWQVRHWCPAVFTDESRFKLSTRDRSEILWRCLQMTVMLPVTWGPARPGVVSGLAAEGAVPWTISARVARGLCTFVRGLLSARVGVVSVAVLPAALDRDLSQCGWPPTGSFLRASGLAAQPCLFSDN